MAKITIAIDTEDHVAPLRLTTSSKKLGLLAAISLTPKMTDAVADGFGAAHHRMHHKATRGQDLLDKRQALVDHGCDVIATIGGLFVKRGISGIADSTIPFVSMVGAIPANPDPYCRGGISLETLALNKARREFLTSKGVDPANICLYRDGRNDRAGEHPANELNEWTNAGGQHKNYLGGKFDRDLSQAGGIPATAEGLVISASPAFLTDANMHLLVTAANTWLTQAPKNKTRYVIYPLQIYGDANPVNAASGRNILLGPDFYQALQVLGVYARLAADGKTPGWLPLGHMITEL
jgi:hypothetical protein